MIDPFINIDFEPLYYDLEAAMSFLRELPDGDPPEDSASPLTYVHMYWKNVHPFGRKQILPIKSFLATQPSSMRLCLWSDKDLTTNELLKPWLPYIDFKIYNPVLEGQGTILQGRQQLWRDDPLVYIGGDLFRALILHKYGGIYVDMDSVFIRPFTCLLGTEFMYKWSFQKDMISSAVMHLHQRSELSTELLRGILALPPGGTNWGCQNNMRAYAKKPFRVFPCAFFNPEWQIKLSDEEKKSAINFAEPFKVNAWTGNMYEGSFVWHWHNQWLTPIEPGCKFELLEKAVDTKLEQQQGRWI